MEELEEKFDKILDIYLGEDLEISIMDSRHALDEFNRHYPNLSIETYYKTIRKGLRKIYRKFNLEQQNYMIISYKYNLRIPLDITKERHTDNLIGIVPTTLSPEEIINLRNEIEVMVEKYRGKKIYEKISLREKDNELFTYNYYYQSGKVFSDFEEIPVD